MPKRWIWNGILIGLLVVLVAGPLIWVKHAEFSGTDSVAMDEIAELAPDYEPWFEPLFEPPGSEVESLLFALQAGIGAGVLGYVAGLLRGRLEKERKRGGPAR
ncbi:MAG: cobalt ABC transporter substrate-binding protein CbiN [Bacillaceae bacterium G1]|nr:MAG: cobalt ABC transporter substrate-binding protein CbiN [Bacillaceae bacterium G1]